MSVDNKGVYPNWVNDKDIINQVLKEIIREGGRLPYSFVVNPTHPDEIKQRMLHILEKMRAEKLIIGPHSEKEYIEIDVEGSRAVHFGYRKYRRIKKWDKYRYTANRVFLLTGVLIILGLFGYIIYLLLHYFKVL